MTSSETRSLLLTVLFTSFLWFANSQKPPTPSGVQILKIYSASILVGRNSDDTGAYIIKAIPNDTPGVTNCYGGDESAVLPFLVTKIESGCSLEARTNYDIGVCAGSIPTTPPSDPDTQTSMSDPLKFDQIQTGPPPPTTLRASSEKWNEIFVEWDDNDVKTVHPVIQYTVYYEPTTSSADGEQSIQTVAVGDGNSANRDKFITITGLQSNTEYTISVVSITCRENKKSDRSSSITGTTIPLPAPTNFGTDLIYSTSIVASWTVVDGLIYKAVAVNKSITINNCEGGETAATSQFTFTKTRGGTDLEERTAYNLALCAVNPHGGISDPAVLPNVNTGPPPPTNLRASSAKSNEIFVEWDDDDNAVHPVIQYIAYYKPTTGNPDNEQSTPTDAVTEGNSANRDKFITITGLQSNTEYTISVVSITCRENKMSDRSSSITGITKLTNFAVDSIFSTSIVTSWRAEEGFTYKAVADPSSVTINNCDGGETATPSSFTFTKTRDGTDIAARTSYNLALCAVNPHGGISDPIVLTNVNTGPPPAAMLKASSAKSDEIFVEWDDDDASTTHPVIQYTVYYEFTSGESDGEQSIQTEAVDEDDSAKRDKFITILGLQSNAKYAISVVSITSNRNETSDRSSLITENTAPANFSVYLIYSTSIVTSWRPENGFTYKAVAEPSSVTINNCDGGESASPSLFTFTKTRDGTDIAARIPYNLALCAVNAHGGISDPIVLKNVSTAPLPSTPAEFQADYILSTTIITSWIEKDSLKYKVVAERSSVIIYNCNRGEVATSPFTFSKTSDETDISARTEYNLAVCEVNAHDEESDPSSISKISTGPSPPTNLRASSNISDETFVEWDDDDASTLHPVLQYTVYYEPTTGSTDGEQSIQTEAVTEDNSANRNKFITITGLQSNTEYTISVVSITSNPKKTSDRSSSTTGTTIPSSIRNLRISPSPEDSTTMMNIEWAKPDGGDQIDAYLVEWVVSSGTNGGSYNLPHIQGISFYNFTTRKLIPGERYDISIGAFNTAGIGKVTLERHRTNPDSVANFSLTQYTSTPSLKLELSWTTPKGIGDLIEIYFISTTTKESIKTKVVAAFTEVYHLLDVLPGNNYTVTLMATSGGLESLPVEKQMNTKSSRIEDVSVTSSSSDVSLMWKLPSGFAEWVVVQYTMDNVCIKASIPSNETFYIVSGLNSNTEYDIMIFTTITSIYGTTEESEKVVNSFTTNKAPTSSPTTLIVGLTVGVVALIVIAFLVGIFYYQKKQWVNKENERDRSRSLSDISLKSSTTTLDNQKSRKLDLKEFNDHMKSMTAIKFATEYQKLFTVGQEQSITSASLPENAQKNRFTNILPYDTTRVQLISPTKTICQNYINASFIPGVKHMKEYIATQGPLDSTRNDFWRLVWEQKSKAIVMLVEIGEHSCSQYWLDSDTAMKVGDLSLSMTSQLVKKDWIEREFKLCKGSEKRNIIQFQMAAWPDNRLPQSTERFCRFVRNVRAVIKEQPEAGPTVVHCSDGSSRTGTFIAIDRLLQHVEDHSFVDIFGIVHELRMHRTNMVATQFQYVLLHQVVQDVMNKVHNIYEELGDGNGVNNKSVETVHKNPAFQYDSII